MACSDTGNPLSVSSPHLAAGGSGRHKEQRAPTWGHISLCQVFQALTARQEEVRGAKARGEDTRRWLKSLAAFGARLRWRSHFMQKLHDEPAIEEPNMCAAFDELRTEFNAAHLEAWAAGRTGFPMVDACMRSLLDSGWLNFRMRCMLVSFACYQVGISQYYWDSQCLPDWVATLSRSPLCWRQKRSVNV